MQITHKVTINAEELEQALWEGVITSANEFCDQLTEDGSKRGVKRGKFEIKEWKQSRKVAVSYAGKLKFTISVPTADEVTVGEDGKLHVKDDNLADAIQLCRK